MVMAGAYAAISGLVGVEALVAGMEEAIPPYRRQHVATNAAAIRAGHAWGEEVA
jgi:2-oxoglutarate ferredoxin oxidoreductase subunit gamma